MRHDAQRAEDAQLIEIGDDGSQVVEAGRRYVLGRRGDEHVIWDTRERIVVRTFVGSRSRRNAWFEFKALEGRQHERRQRAKTRWTVVGGLSLAIVLVVAGTVAISLRGSSTGTGPPAPRADASTVNRIENPIGGYAFRVPATWTDLQDGTSTEVTSSSGDVTVTVDRAGTGDAVAAATSGARSLTTGWTTVELEAPQQRTVGEAPAVSVSGTGTMADGESSRFVSIVVTSGADTYAIAITVRSGADPAVTTPAIDELLSAFRIPTA
jgi:hypothetical protein